ncbi:hypothetical protein [Pseudarthrobacter phenanthrenivorans]
MMEVRGGSALQHGSMEFVLNDYAQFRFDGDESLSRVMFNS